MRKENEDVKTNNSQRNVFKERSLYMILLHLLRQSVAYYTGKDNILVKWVSINYDFIGFTGCTVVR